MAFRALAYNNSSSDDDLPDLPSLQASTSETSTFGITPCPSTSSIFPTDEQQKSSLLSLGLEGFCCCVSAEELASDALDQPVVGWEGRRTISRHFISSQLSESSHGPAAFDSAHHSHNSADSSEKASYASGSTLFSKGAFHLGSETKSQLRKYIHSTQPDIPYIFRHHKLYDDESSRYIEDYKCCYTYPSLEEKSRKTSVVSSCSSTTAVKPTLFVLGGDLYRRHLQCKV